MSKIRVLLVDDHAIVRAGIRSLLRPYSDIEVIGEATDGWEAIVETTKLEPEIVLLDIAMGEINGLEVAQEIRERVPHVKVLALTMLARPETCFAMLRAGAMGYLLKNSEPEELIAAIRAVHRGEAYLCPAMTKAVLNDYLAQDTEHVRSRYDSLTSREREVLHLIADGMTSREIADVLNLSIKTIEKHRASVMRKLELHNLAEVVKYAIRKGLIDIDEY